MSGDRTARVGYGAALASGEFRALFAAQLVSLAGSSVAAVTLTVLIFRRTGSPLLASKRKWKIGKRSFTFLVLFYWTRASDNSRGEVSLFRSRQKHSISCWHSFEVEGTLLLKTS